MTQDSSQDGPKDCRAATSSSSRRARHRRGRAGRSQVARAAPIELRYFYRAPWPSSETYANWMIDEWNKKNGSRVHVTGASIDGETYKTKLTSS